MWTILRFPPHDYSTTPSLPLCFPCLSPPQFKHLMQPFDVTLAPGGIYVHRDTTRATSAPTSFFATATLSITNRYDHTKHLWEPLTFDWVVEVDGLAIAKGNDLVPVFCSPAKGKAQPRVSAQASNSPAAAAKAGDPTRTALGAASDEGATGAARRGKVSTVKVAFEAPSLLLPGQECWLTVTGRLREGTPWAAVGHVVGHVQLELNSGQV